MDLNSKILITGGSGMLGRAIVDELRRLGYSNVVAPLRQELDLLDNVLVNEYLTSERPEYVFHLASLVYGLKGNMRNQYDSLVKNTKIYSNVLECIGGNFKPKKIFFAGTVASYGFPYVKQPIQEEDFFNGLPHEGEYGYAMAKRHAYNYLKIAKELYGVDYIYGLLTNLFGEHDTFDAENGHVIPSLILKAVDSIEKDSDNFEVWGNPESKRDFLYIKDAAKAVIFLMMNGSGIYNISTGKAKTMRELALSISKNLSNSVSPVWNSDEPVGISERMVSNKKLRSLGFSDYTDFDLAIGKTISWYRS